MLSKSGQKKEPRYKGQSKISTPTSVTDGASKVTKLPVKDWTSELEEYDRGGFKRNAHNILTILKEDPKLSGKLACDSFKNAEIVTSRLPWDNEDRRRIWQDDDDACLRNYIDLNYGIRSRELIDDCLRQEFKRASFHPVRDYLNTLKWDGVPRLDRLMIKYLGAEESEYTQTVTRKAFTAAVARVICPGSKYDTLLTLVGPQGVGKSTVFRLMGKDWFLDSLQNTNDKDALQTIQGSWIVEIAELSALRKSEREAFKAFVASTVDKYRPSYGRRIVERPRQCVFFGTTNEDTFLRDETGERRFWPVRVTRKMTPQEISEFTHLVDQFWAEAKHYYEQGETLFLNEEQEAAANIVRGAFVDIDPRKGLIEEYLEIVLPQSWKSKSINERREYIQGEYRTETGEKRTRISAIEVHCELFGEPKGKFSSAKGREFASIFKGLKGWKFIGQQRVSDEYGRQQTFERITDQEPEPAAADEWGDLVL